MGFSRLSNNVLRRLSGMPVPQEAKQAPPPLQVVSQMPAKKSFSLSMDYPLIWFSRHDPWTLEQALEGVQIMGESGSGKTSGSGRAFALAYLKAGFGGLVLTMKSDERQLWQRYAAEAGRAEDLIILSPDQPWRFNFLQYLFVRPVGGGLENAHNAVSLFMNLLESLYAGGKRREGDSFWVDGVRRLLRNTLELMVMAGEPITIDQMLRLIHASGSGETSNYFTQTLEKAKAHAHQFPSASISMIESYFVDEFRAKGATKQAAGILSTLTGMIDPFLSGHLRTLFCTDLNLTPEVTRMGKIIIMDMPVAQWEQTGRSAQLIFKYIWQKAITTRQGLPQGERPVFLWADEAQQFATPHDLLYFQTSRSSFATTIYLTQNISNYHALLEQTGGGTAQTNALLGNLSTRIFHRNADTATNQWAADMIGKYTQTRRNMQQGSNDSRSFNYSRNSGRSWGSTHGQMQNSANSGYSSGSSYGESSSYGSSNSQGWTEVVDYLIEPSLFTRLHNGGAKHQHLVQGIIFKPGMKWHRTGYTFIDVSFAQHQGR